MDFLCLLLFTVTVKKLNKKLSKYLFVIKIEFLLAVIVAYCMIGTGGSPKTLLCGHWASKEGLGCLRHQTVDCPSSVTSWVAGPPILASSIPPPPTQWFDPYTLPLPAPTAPNSPRAWVTVAKLLCGRTLQTLTLAPGQGHRHYQAAASGAQNSGSMKQLGR